MVIRMEHEEDVPLVHVDYEASKGVTYYAKVSVSPPAVIEGWLPDICWEDMEEWIEWQARTYRWVEGRAADYSEGGFNVSAIRASTTALIASSSEAPQARAWW